MFHLVSEPNQYYGATEEEYVRIYEKAKKFGSEKRKVPAQFKARLYPFIFFNERTYNESHSSVKIAICTLTEIRPFQGIVYRLQKSRTTVSMGPTQIKNGQNDFREDHIIVRDYVECADYRLGGAGVSVSTSIIKKLKFNLVKQNPVDFIFHLCVDIPIFLPIENAAVFTISYNGNHYRFQHFVKKRGEEYFSTIDSNFLPNFSTLAISGKAFGDINEYYSIANYVLKGIFNFLIKEKVPAQVKYPILSLFVHFYQLDTYIDARNRGKLVAQLIFPYYGEIDIKSVYSPQKIDSDSLREFLLQKVAVLGSLRKGIEPKVHGKVDFRDKLFIMVHDFNYYCTQHSRAINQLKEDHIRDLFIVLAKSVFKYAEAEAFNFDGKLDFKIVNPDNQYEFVTGEFKWWAGKESFKEAFHQAVRKHASGQEMEIYIIILARNRNNAEVLQQCDHLIKSEVEYRSEVPFELPRGSRLLFRSYVIESRENQIKLILGVSDLYYENK